MNFDEILAAANQLDGNGSGVEEYMNESVGQSYNPDVFTLGEGEDIDSYLQNYTSGTNANEVYEQLGLNKNKTNYNADANMELQRKLYEGKAEMTSCAKHIPSAILDSIVNNPLNINPNMVTGDDNIDMLGEKAQSTMARFATLTEQLEKKDKEKTQLKGADNTISTPKMPSQSNYSPIDYALIKTIVKECLEEYGKANKCGVMLSTEDGFKFRDAEDNIFECKMTYIGKAKKKNK